MSVPREPKHYFPSVHAIDRAKARGIDWDIVSKTIQEGEIKKSHKDGCRLFVKDYQHTDNPVGVVANIESGEILTVQWRR